MQNAYMPKQTVGCQNNLQTAKKSAEAEINWAQNEKQKTKAESKLFEQKTHRKSRIWNPIKKQAELQKQSSKCEVIC